MIFLYLIACAIGFLSNEVKGVAIAILIVAAFDLVRWAVNGLMEVSK